MKNKFSLGLVLFFVGIIIVGLISYRAIEETYRTRKIEQEVINLKQDAERIQKDNDALANKIAYLQSPEFQQRVAKDKLNMQLPDENVVIVKQSQKDAAVASSVQATQEENSSDSPNYVKWWNYFFH